MSFFNRPVAFATLIVLSTPFAAMAQTATPQATTAQTANAISKMETVDQRITSLHDSLKITPAQEVSWTAVATSMRDNAANMQKLTAEKSMQDQQKMTATDDLQAYSKFAQAHVDGLKNLSMSFGTLYNDMPAAQQKVADQVFQDFGRKGSAAPK